MVTSLVAPRTARFAVVLSNTLTFLPTAYKLFTLEPEMLVFAKLPAIKLLETVAFETDMLRISFTGVGIQGGCPAEKDNVGCYYLKDGTFTLVPAEKITANKEFCDCEFAWRFAGGAHSVSLGKTLPAIPEEETTHYEKAAFTVENAAVIPCTQVLGAYQVTFER